MVRGMSSSMLSYGTHASFFLLFQHIELLIWEIQILISFPLSTVTKKWIN